jgi:hypothetical protein
MGITSLLWRSVMDINLDENTSILYVKPTPPLKVEDFVQLTAIADAYLTTHGQLKGLVVETLKFPGWENLDAFKAHVKFISKHQSRIQKIAIVTDSQFAVIAEKVVGALVAPKLKRFSYGQTDLATQWILSA